MFFPFPPRSEQGKEVLLLTRHFNSFCLIPLQETNPHFLQIPLLPAYTLQPCKKTLTNLKEIITEEPINLYIIQCLWVQDILEIRARQPHLNQTFVLGMHGSSNITLHIKRSKKFSNENLSYKSKGSSLYCLRVPWKSCHI